MKNIWGIRLEKNGGRKKKRSRGWKTLKNNKKNENRSLNPRQNRVDINNSDTLDGKKIPLKVCDY